MRAGIRIGQYEIGKPIGSGGMGEVYRATDARLQRSVAIKFLSSELADPAARERFQREARMTSSLNHPHILTVYDVGEYEGRQYLVTEFVDGGTLRDWLARARPLWRQTLELLAGVADGLASAHAAGVLHRDIKPANILVSQNGYAKIADFGLAKLIEAGDAPTGAAVALPDAPTRTGMILGTVAYMSPEQAMGRSLDARSDVFSFGLVLYEALMGRRPFSSESDLEILHSIVHKAPQPLDPSLPVALRLIIEKALEKDPAERYQSMREVVVDLRRVLKNKAEAPAAGSPLVAAPVPRSSRKAWVAVLIVAALGVGVLGGRLWAPRSPNAIVSDIRQQRLTDAAGMEQMPAVSRDGKIVAFVASVNGKQQIFGKLLDKGAPIQITREDGDHAYPRWVDENTLIYFLRPDSEGASGSLWETVVLSSAPPRLIASSQGEGDISPDSRQIVTFRTDNEGQALVIIERDGSRAETVKRLPSGTYTRPRWSPDGRSIAFEVRSDLNTFDIRVMGPDGQTKTIVLSSAVRGFAWLPDGSGLLYASAAGSTMVYPPMFSLRTVSIDGSRDSRVPVGDAGYASFVEPDLTASGKLVVSRVRMDSDIFRFPIDGTPRENVMRALQITHQTGQVQVPTVSPDGTEVAYLSDSGGHANLWVASVNGTHPPRKITDERDPQISIGIPHWSPRGNRILYIKQNVGKTAMERLVNSDGTGDHQLVPDGRAAFWSHDGEWVFYLSGAPNTPEKPPCIHKIRPDGGDPVRIRCDAASMTVASDGLTAYFSPSVDRMGEVWRVKPFETGKPEPLITNLQSRIPLWPHHYDLSPNDLWLATPLKDRETTNLWMISTKDGSLRQVTDFQERPTLIARQVSWSSDNKYIFAALVNMDADVVLLDGGLINH